VEGRQAGSSKPTHDPLPSPHHGSIGYVAGGKKLVNHDPKIEGETINIVQHGNIITAVCDEHGSNWVFFQSVEKC
jgi:hypothetical protein